MPTHVGPLLTVARGLVDRGDRVTVLTSQRHALKIVAAGTSPEPLPAATMTTLPSTRTCPRAGVNLRTGTPSPQTIREAARRVLADGRYRRRTHELEADFARRDGVAEIAALVDEVIEERSPAALRSHW